MITTRLMTLAEVTDMIGAEGLNSRNGMALDSALSRVFELEQVMGRARAVAKHLSPLHTGGRPTPEARARAGLIDIIGSVGAGTVWQQSSRKVDLPDGPIAATNASPLLDALSVEIEPNRLGDVQHLPKMTPVVDLPEKTPLTAATTPTTPLPPTWRTAAWGADFSMQLWNRGLPRMRAEAWALIEAAIRAALEKAVLDDVVAGGEPSGSTTTADAWKAIAAALDALGADGWYADEIICGPGTALALAGQVNAGVTGLPRIIASHGAVGHIIVASSAGLSFYNTSAMNLEVFNVEKVGVNVAAQAEATALIRRADLVRVITVSDTP